jgi:hypothetical protein
MGVILELILDGHMHLLATLFRPFFPAFAAGAGAGGTGAGSGAEGAFVERASLVFALGGGAFGAGVGSGTGSGTGALYWYGLETIFFADNETSDLIVKCRNNMRKKKRAWSRFDKLHSPGKHTRCSRQPG